MSTAELTPVADRICAYLQRFEADPVINAPRSSGGMSTTPFFHAFAVAARKRVTVQYVSYQGTSLLTADEAIRYLAWLDGGGIGRHYQIPAAFRG